MPPPSRARRIYLPSGSHRFGGSGRRCIDTVCASAAGTSGAGAVRRCHGDLHLRNIAVINGQPVLFDAIELTRLSLPATCSTTSGFC